MFRKNKKGLPAPPTGQAGGRQGFTIIEVLIVLAIAGLILLIVFLAVPTLQRNTRNNGYKSEASRFFAAVQEFASNSGGILPACSSYPCSYSPTSACTVGNSSTDDPAKIYTLVNPKNITCVNMWNDPNGAGRLASLNGRLQIINIETNVTCGTPGGTTMTPTAAQPYNYVVIYGLENADGTVNTQCLHN